MDFMNQRSEIFQRKLSPTIVTWNMSMTYSGHMARARHDGPKRCYNGYWNTKM